MEPEEWEERIITFYTYNVTLDDKESYMWYKRPWNMLTSKGYCQPNYSPKEYVEAGKGEEILELLRFYKGDQA